MKIDDVRDDVSIVNIGEFVALAGEMLDVLSERLIALLLAVVKIPRVFRMGECTLEVSHEDRAEVSPVADVAGIELLEPRPC